MEDLTEAGRGAPLVIKPAVPAAWLMPCKLSTTTKLEDCLFAACVHCAHKIILFLLV